MPAIPSIGSFSEFIPNKDHRQVIPTRPTLDILRININAYELINQSLNPTSNNHIKRSDKIVESFSLLAPMDIQETIVHNWEDYNSMMGRFTNIYANMTRQSDKLVKAFEGIKEGGLQLTGTLDKNQTSRDIKQVDLPLVYTGTQRREYSFMFQLSSYGLSDGTAIIDIVNKFRELGCAGTVDLETDGGISKDPTKIKYPHIFEIKSSPKSFIHIKNAALVAVQPLFSGPYVYGNPSKCELSLTFRDLEPLYKKSWAGTKEGKLTIGPISI